MWNYLSSKIKGCTARHPYVPRRYLCLVEVNASVGDIGRSEQLCELFVMLCSKHVVDSSAKNIVSGSVPNTVNAGQ